MTGLVLKPALEVVDLSRAGGPQTAKVVVVGLPKNNVGIVFGQRTAAWPQRFNTYLLDTDHLVVNPQAVWDAPSAKDRFLISQVIPTGFDKDPSVLCMGPYTEDRNIAVYISHQQPNSTDFVQSEAHTSYHDFKIGNKTAISFTMARILALVLREFIELFSFGKQINAEDGGDADFHDTVVGIAVAATSK